MNAPLTQPLPMKIRRGLKRETRVQFASLCYRYKNDKLQFLLVTSRRRGRWILPKGWPENGLTPAEAALREAYEEGGVKGEVFDACVGIYNYSKIHGPVAGLPKVVMVFPVSVKKLVKSYPEASQRRRKWFSRKGAAARVDESQLRKII
ncbi:MAG: NUDIX hydrolase, partial [Pseudomonadota bacterium]